MKRSVLFPAAVAAALLIPLVMTRNQQNLLIMVAHYATLATWWNVLGGFAGQVSLGHGLFLGAGAYTSSFLFKRWLITPWLGILPGMLLAALLALVLGAVVYRSQLRGAYFTLATLVSAQVAAVIINNVGIFGSSTYGMSLPVKGNAPALFQFTGKLAYYYVALALLGIALTCSWWLARSRVGLRLMAIRENEQAGAALGVNVYRHKMLATVISAVGTAASGTFLAQYLLYVDTRTVLGLDVSLSLIIFSVVGGVGTVFGPFLGALALVPMADWIRAWLGGVPGANLLTYGVVLILATYYLPDGLMGLFSRFVPGEEVRAGHESLAGRRPLQALWRLVGGTWGIPGPGAGGDSGDHRP